MNIMSSFQRSTALAVTGFITAGMLSVGMMNEAFAKGSSSSSSGGARGGTSAAAGSAARSSAVASSRAAMAANNASRAASIQAGQRAATASAGARAGGPKYTIGNHGGGRGNGGGHGGGYSMGGHVPGGNRYTSTTLASSHALYTNTYYPHWYYWMIISNNHASTVKQIQGQQENRLEGSLLTNPSSSSGASTSCVFLKMAKEGWAAASDRSMITERLDIMTKSKSFASANPPEGADLADKRIWAAGKSCLKME